MTREDESGVIVFTPLFVSVTETMVVTEHNRTAKGGCPR